MHELQKAKIKARAEEGEALAKLRLEQAALDAEEKLLACSERGLSVTSLRSSKSRRSKTARNTAAKQQTTESKNIRLPDYPVTKPRKLAENYVQKVKRKPLHKTSLTRQSCNLTIDEPANTKLGEKQWKTAFKTL